MVLLLEEAHVWTVQLDQIRHCLDEMRRLLDNEERERAARFRSSEAAERFILCHGSLRIILSRYLPMPPEHLRFCADSHGKPNLVGTDGYPAFNLSHSADLALVAVARQPIGIDVERIDPDLSFQTIAERYFSCGEKADLRSVPGDSQLSAFYACWTRKEAYIKACGAGFSLAPDRFRVSVRQDEPPALLDHEITANETGIWRLADLEVPSGFRGAIAVAENITSIQMLAL